MSKQCCICGTTIGFMTADRRYYNGQGFDICANCQEAFTKVKSGKASKVESGSEYLRAKRTEGVITPEALTMVADALGEIDHVKDTANSQYRVSSGIPFFAGVVFFILAVILYIASVNNNYGVANIQSTVFSAASFVAAIVCFAASSIIRAMNSR